MLSSNGVLCVQESNRREMRFGADIWVRTSPRKRHSEILRRFSDGDAILLQQMLEHSILRSCSDTQLEKSTSCSDMTRISSSVVKCSKVISPLGSSQRSSSSSQATRSLATWQDRLYRTQSSRYRTASSKSPPSLVLNSATRRGDRSRRNSKWLTNPFRAVGPQYRLATSRVMRSAGTPFHRSRQRGRASVGEDARSHDGRRRQEGQDVLQEPVRERAQAVGTAGRSLPLAPRGPAPLRHSVEPVAGVRPRIANKTRAALRCLVEPEKGVRVRERGESVGTHCAIASPVFLLLASPALARTSGKGSPRARAEEGRGEPNTELEAGRRLGHGRGPLGGEREEDMGHLGLTSRPDRWWAVFPKNELDDNHIGPSLHFYFRGFDVCSCMRCSILKKKKKFMQCSSFKQTQFYMNANLSTQILQMCRPTETSLYFDTSNTLSPFINI
jgi:hypothetical protein